MRCILAATLASFIGVGQTQAALDFSFSFSNVDGNLPGTVSGTIDGLPANGTATATSVTITSYPAFPANNLPPSPPLDTTSWTAFEPNTFTTVNGQITAASFGSYAFFASGIQYAELDLDNASLNGFFFSTSNRTDYVQNHGGTAGVMFHALAPMPEPSSMIVWGLGAMGLLLRKRCRP